MTSELFAFARERAARVRPRDLLLAAAGLHVLTTLVILGAGRLSILPKPFIPDSGGHIAFDSFRYQQEAKGLVGVLSNDGVAAWLNVPVQSHVYLYSLFFAIFAPLFGYSILAVEPLNLLYYLATMTLVYEIGKEAFGKATGLTAAIVIGLWPSFLLHTTQVLKDPLFIVCMLALVFVCITWLTRIGSWKSAFWTVPVGAASIAVLARMKSNMWGSVVVLVLVGLMLLLARQALARRVFVQNILSAALIIAFTLVMPVKSTEVHRRDQTAIETTEHDGQTSFVWRSLGARIAERRRVFSRSGGPQGSAIDTAMFFDNTGDIVRYLPRAMLIGAFSPFPRMWLAPASTTGRAARILSGAETLLFYLVALAAGICAYVERRNFASWFLLLVALINMIALGLVVTNIGTLFRLRYVFWMLIIIMGARGAVFLAHKFRDDYEPNQTRTDRALR
ncbi:MAG: glycosyltransferase family 39 protein [Pyrinomonadaceae bacterium]|nr:glycosyltransferase family 39 protein [Pyrinomonadaceae bacterium]